MNNPVEPVRGRGRGIIKQNNIVAHHQLGSEQPVEKLHVRGRGRGRKHIVKVELEPSQLVQPSYTAEEEEMNKLRFEDAEEGVSPEQ